MKNKKGFTLVEMLGVLIILVIIFMIAFPTLTRVLKNTEEDLANSEKTIVVDATKDLLNSKKDIYIPNDDNTYCIAFETLMNQGKLTENQVENISEDYNTVKVTYKNRKAIYEVLGAGCTEVIKDAHLELVGKANVNLELASDGSVKTYVEEGLNFINNGVVTYLDFTLDNLYPDLSIEVISQKTGNITTYLPETVLDTYVIKYAYMAEDGKTYYAERTVKIGDNEAPVIVVNPAEITLPITNNNYDVRSGVTVTDNSGVLPNLTVSTNLRLGKVGEYVVNYTAVDKSGNKSVAKRIVKITSDNVLVQVDLLGDKVMEIEQYTIFTDPGAKATGSDGLDYTNEIEKTGRFGDMNESSLDTSKLGLHYITYSVIKNGVTSSATRIVEVVPGTMNVSMVVNELKPGSASVTTEVSDIEATYLTYKYYYKLSTSSTYTPVATKNNMPTSSNGYTDDYTYSIPNFGVYDLKVVVIADGKTSGEYERRVRMIEQDLTVTLYASPMGAATNMYLFTNVKEEVPNLTYTYYYKLSSSDIWTEASYEMNTNPNIHYTIDVPDEYDDAVDLFLSDGFVSYDFKVVVSDGAFASGEAYTTEENYCFVAGTKVETENGLMNIEDIKIGDKVYAVDEESGTKELRPVLNTITSYVSEIYHIYVEDEIIKASPKHQFYIVDKGWVRAKDLKVGDMVIADGERKPIKKIKYENLGKPIPMYNLSVDGINTYLITKYSILVHNINYSIPVG